MRKVSVGLAADVGEFIRNMLGAKKSVDDLGDKVEELDKELDKIPGDAARASAALKLLDGDVKSVGRTVDDLGQKNVGLNVLDAKIRETQKEVRKLGEEFVKTGDIDVFRKLGDAEGRLRGLKDTRKKLADAIVPGPEEIEGFFKRVMNKADALGSSIGKMLPDAVSGALATPVLGPIIATALIAALLAAVTIVLANAGALALAAGALGGVGLGIMGAILGDPEAVGKAWGEQIDALRQQFLGATVVFRGPLIEAAHTFGSVVSGINFDKIFAKSATYLPELTAGAAGFARWMGVAFEYLVDGAGPVVRVLAQELPKIGHAIATASKSISEGSEGGAAALKDLLTVVEYTIAGLGGFIRHAEDMYLILTKIRQSAAPDWMVHLPEEFNPFMQKAARSLNGVGDSAKSAAVSYEGFVSALNNTPITADQAIGALTDKVLDMMLALDRATLSFEESLTRLNESFKTNGDEVDIHTKKGQANREAILAGIEAAKRQYDTMLAGNSTIGEATAKWDENIARLVDAARKAHLTESEIADLITRYGKVPGNVNTEVGAKGLTDVLRGLDLTLQRLLNLDGKVANTYLYNHVITQYGLDMGLGHQGSHQAQGGVRRAAMGMVIPPSDPGTTLVAEPQTGGELLFPLMGLERNQARGLLQFGAASYGLSVGPPGAAGGGMQTLRVVLQYPDGRVIRDQVVEWNANRGRSDPATFFMP